MISAAKIEAKVLSDRNASVEDIQSKAVELASLHTDDEGLPDGQLTMLIDLIQRQIDKHMHPDNIEAKIIDADNKNLWFMWGKIKRTYPVGDTFPLPTEEARKLCGCSKTDVAPIFTHRTHDTQFNPLLFKPFRCVTVWVVFFLCFHQMS